MTTSSASIPYPIGYKPARNYWEQNKLQNHVIAELDIEVVIVPGDSPLKDASVEEIEARSEGQFFIVQINRQNGDVIHISDRSQTVQGGDGIVILGRSANAARTMFETAAKLAG